MHPAPSRAFPAPSLCKMRSPQPVVIFPLGAGQWMTGQRGLQAASGISSVVSMLLSTAWMGWKGLRSRGLYSPATLRKQAPFPGNDQPGSQHGPRGHPAWWVLDLGYRKPPPDVSVLGLSPTKTELSLPPRTVPTPLESPRLHCSCAGGGGGRKGIG